MGTTRAARLARLGGGLAATAAILLGPIASADAVEPTKYQLTVTDTFPPGGGIRFNVQVVPEVFEAGVYKIGLANNSIGPHVFIAVGNFPADVDTEAEFLALVDAVESGEIPPPEDAIFAGAVFAKPGQDHQKQFDLTQPGLYGYFCPIQTPSGVPHYELGFIGLFEVAG